jgi:hypothetical protein
MLGESSAFGTFLVKPRAKDWVVYAKPPFGGPEAVLSQAIHVYSVSPENM